MSDAEAGTGVNAGRNGTAVARGVLSKDGSRLAFARDGTLFVSLGDRFSQRDAAQEALWRLQLDGNKVVAREALLTGLNERIRDVRQGPDGSIYLVTDGAADCILRVQHAA